MLCSVKKIMRQGVCLVICLSIPRGTPESTTSGPLPGTIMHHSATVAGSPQATMSEALGHLKLQCPLELRLQYKNWLESRCCSTFLRKQAAWMFGGPPSRASLITPTKMGMVVRHHATGQLF